LFETKTFDQINVGTNTTPSQQKASLTFCNNIPELVRRQLANKNMVDIPTAIKLGLDCGKNKLLFTLQSTYSNSIENILVIAVSLKMKENDDCIKTVFEETKIDNYISAMSRRVFFSADIKVNWLTSGLIGGNS